VHQYTVELENAGKVETFHVTAENYTEAVEQAREEARKYQKDETHFDVVSIQRDFELYKGMIIKVRTGDYRQALKKAVILDIYDQEARDFEGNVIAYKSMDVVFIEGEKDEGAIQYVGDIESGYYRDEWRYLED
jgi:hypothetical protein